MTRWTLALAAAIALGTPSARAHQSIYSIYDRTRPATLEGTVAEFQLINPHPFLFIDVADASGAAQRWRLEMDNRTELADIGVTAATFKPGDRVVVSGAPAADPAPPPSRCAGSHRPARTRSRRRGDRAAADTNAAAVCARGCRTRRRDRRA